MSTLSAPLTNRAYGFPAGSTTRRVKPVALMCIHITGNGANVGPTAATAERAYANRPASPGPSAHDYINRDGSVVSAIDPAKSAAWSNGIINAPNTSLPLVAAVLALRARGYNANEAYYREVECVGTPALPITPAQKIAIAALIAADAQATGLPISRATVGTHSDLDSVNRPRCAFNPSVRERELADIIARAIAASPAIAPAAAPTVVPAETISALRQLIANLAAVKAPTQAVRDKLATYRGRLAEYLGRGT